VQSSPRRANGATDQIASVLFDDEPAIVERTHANEGDVVQILPDGRDGSLLRSLGLWKIRLSPTQGLVRHVEGDFLRSD
jgi:hypothetical protein